MARNALTDDEVAGFRARAVIAAEKLFEAKGLEGMSMRALATELGCSAMTPYRYFETQEHLVAEVRASAFKRLAGVLEAAATRPRAPRTKIEAISKAYIDFGVTDPNAYRLMFDLRPPKEPRPDLVQASIDSFAPLLRAVTDAIGAGVLEGDALTVAHVIWASLHGIVSLEVADKLNFGRSASALTTALFTQLFA